MDDEAVPHLESPSLDDLEAYTDSDISFWCLPPLEDGILQTLIDEEAENILRMLDELRYEESFSIAFPGGQEQCVDRLQPLNWFWRRLHYLWREFLVGKADPDEEGVIRIKRSERLLLVAREEVSSAIRIIKLTFGEALSLETYDRLCEDICRLGAEYFLVEPIADERSYVRDMCDQLKHLVFDLDLPTRTGHRRMHQALIQIQGDSNLHNELLVIPPNAHGITNAMIQGFDESETAHLHAIMQSHQSKNFFLKYFLIGRFLYFLKNQAQQRSGAASEHALSLDVVKLAVEKLKSQSYPIKPETLLTSHRDQFLGYLRAYELVRQNPLEAQSTETATAFVARAKKLLAASVQPVAPLNQFQSPEKRRREAIEVLELDNQVPNYYTGEFYAEPSSLMYLPPTPRDPADMALDLMESWLGYEMEVREANGSDSEG
jgi:hypothetical protein